MGKKKEKNINVTKEQFSWHLERLKPMFIKKTADLGFKLVLAEFLKEYGFNYLRITISQEGRTINLDDCEKVSRALNEELDKDIKINFPYSLEVQSPGPSAEPQYSGEKHEFSVKGLDLVVNS